MLPRAVAFADLYRRQLRAAGTCERRCFAAVHLLEPSVCEALRRIASVHDDGDSHAISGTNGNADDHALSVAEPG